MNENINLIKILKDCPKGWKFYTDEYDEVTFGGFSDLVYPICINTKNNGVRLLGEKGEEIIGNGKCILFPSKDQRDWSKFIAPWYKNEKFDPKTLKPFDKVLVIDSDRAWTPLLFSYLEYSLNYPRMQCFDFTARKVIPYNRETEHLLGTHNEAPEYYRYWED